MSYLFISCQSVLTQSAAMHSSRKAELDKSNKKMVQMHISTAPSGNNMNTTLNNP